MIPYYNPNTNKISRYFPDFIFWLKSNNSYQIIFIDSKGTEHISYQRKIDCFKKMLEENEKDKNFKYNGFIINPKIAIELLN